MKFIVEVRDDEVRDVWPEKVQRAHHKSGMELALEDIRDSLDIGSVFTEFTVTHLPDGAA